MHHGIASRDTVAEGFFWSNLATRNLFIRECTQRKLMTKLRMRTPRTGLLIIHLLSGRVCCGRSLASCLPPLLPAPPRLFINCVTVVEGGRGGVRSTESDLRTDEPSVRLHSRPNNSQGVVEKAKAAGDQRRLLGTERPRRF